MTDSPTPTRQARWFESAWRRVVIDMHIPDWDPRFLSKLDADRCIEAFARANVQSAVFSAQSHTGLFNYPTRVGREHAGLGGRDLVAEMHERCRARGIAFVIYVSLIFDRYAYDLHPQWRGVDPLGCDKFEFGPDGRYGLLCPNSPYRDYVRAWVEELCGRYDFDGIRFDMTYWPGVCVCGHCRSRWEREVGGGIPATIDWTDPRWVLFQRKREEWMGDFASIATGTVRRLRPRASVEHQASTFPATWMFGVSHPLVPHNDFLEGDFYGSALQGSFARKLLGELTPNRPFCYETSTSVDLRDHTGRKPEALLEVKASAAIADHAAFLYIDAIDPDGTVNPVAHERMGRVWEKLGRYHPELGGDRVADIAIYYSLDSKFDMRDNGKPLAEAQPRDTHTPSAMNVASRLGAAHLPFTVITAERLGELGRFRVLVLANVHHLSPAEAEAIRGYVRAGGCLYASCGTSLVTTEGRRLDDFQLGDVLGVSLARADWSDRVHFLAPTPEGAGEFAGWTREQPPILRGPGFEVRAAPGATVLATTTLPWRTPDPTRFSSIHSDPPWEQTSSPEVVFNRFGKGRCVYCASPLEDAPGLAEGFIALIRRLGGDFAFEADAPAWVELSLFRQAERRRHVLSLLSFQAEQPGLPVDGIRVRLRLGRGVSAVRELPGGAPVPHREEEGALVIDAPRLRTLALLALEDA